MHNMIFQGLRIDEDIVEIHHNTNSDQQLQELVHDPHKSARGICKPKWHHKPFKKPLWVLKVVFHSSLGRIRIWWYPIHRSTLEKILELAKLSNISSNRGIGNQYLMVILLMILESMYILQEPSFLGVKSVGTAYGLILCRMYPLSKSSWTWRWSSSFFLGAIL